MNMLENYRSDPELIEIDEETYEAIDGIVRSKISPTLHVDYLIEGLTLNRGYYMVDGVEYISDNYYQVKPRYSKLRPSGNKPYKTYYFVEREHLDKVGYAHLIKN